MGLDEHDLSRPARGITTGRARCPATSVSARSPSMSRPVCAHKFRVRRESRLQQPHALGDRGLDRARRPQPFDGLVLLVGCDKTAPGAVMAMLRSLVLYSGAMAPGEPRRSVTILDVWEAVGARAAPSPTRSSTRDRAPRLPGVRRLHGHFTANTMAVTVDFLGLGPMGSAASPRWIRQRRDRGSAGSCCNRARTCVRAALAARRSRNIVRCPRDRRDQQHSAASLAIAGRAGARGFRPALGIDAGRDEPDAGRSYVAGDLHRIRTAARPPARRRGDRQQPHARPEHGPAPEPGRRGARAG